MADPRLRLGFLWSENERGLSSDEEGGIEVRSVAQVRPRGVKMVCKDVVKHIYLHIVYTLTNYSRMHGSRRKTEEWEKEFNAREFCCLRLLFRLLPPHHWRTHPLVLLSYSRTHSHMLYVCRTELKLKGGQNSIYML